MISSRLALIVCILFVPSVVLADLSIKRRILEDCPKALDELDKLSESEELELIPYLGRVLNLDVRSPVAGEDFLPMGLEKTHGDRPLLGAPVGELWRTFEPSREIEAKECSLKIIERLSDKSFPILPEIISFGIDEGILDTLRAKADSLVLRISRGAANDPGFVWDAELGKRLIQTLQSPKAEFNVESVFIEIGEPGVQSLIEGLRHPKRNIRDAVSIILKKVSSDEGLVTSGLESLLESVDEDVRRRAVELLGSRLASVPTVSPSLIGRLQDVSTTVQDAAIAALAKLADEKIEVPVLDEKSIEILIDSYTRLDSNRQETLAPVLGAFISKSPSLDGRLISFYGGASLESRIALLKVYRFSPKLSDAAFGALVNGLSDKSDEVSLTAIRSIASDRARTEQVLLHISKLLKTKSGDRSTSEDLGKFVVAVARTVVEIDAGAKARSLVPYFVGAISVEPESEGESNSSVVQALVSIGRDARAPLLKALKDPKIITRRRAIFVLAKIDGANLSPIAEGLTDKNQEVRRVAKEALISKGEASTSIARKYLRSKEVETRIDASVVVLSVRPQDKEASEIAVREYPNLPCSERASLMDKLNRELVTESILQQLVACLAERRVVGEQALEALILFSPTPEIVRRGILEVVRGGSVDRQLSLTVLGESSKLGLSDQDVQEYLLTLLRSSEDSVRIKAIGVLGGIKGDTKKTTPELLRIARDSGAEGALRAEAVVSLVKLDPSAFPYEEFFLDKLKDQESEWIEVALTQIDPSIAVPILLKSIEETRGSDLVRSIRVLGDVKEGGPGVVSKLLTFLSSEEPPIKYAAFVSLLKLAPNDLGVKGALPQILVSREGSNLNKENVESALAPLLEEILMNPESRVVRYRASTLLKAISSFK